MKPCPYCGKKLQVKGKHSWRNNLARHLANTCQPYQREQLAMWTRIAGQLITAYVPGAFHVPFMQMDAPEDPLAKAKEVEELERLLGKE